MDVYAVRWGVLNLFGFTIGGIHIAGHSRERSQGEAPSSQGVPRSSEPPRETEGQIATWNGPPIFHGEELPSHFWKVQAPLSLLLPKLEESLGLIIDLKV